MILVRLVVRHVVSCVVMISGGVGGGAVPCHSVGRGLDEGLVGVRPGGPLADDGRGYFVLFLVTYKSSSKSYSRWTKEVLTL